MALGYRRMDSLGAELVELRAELAAVSDRNPGPCRLRRELFGVGPVLSVVTWAEMGDCRRFTNSDQSVRHCGLDVSVYASDTRRAAGHLTRQGPPLLRWALYEAAKSAARPTSPDHDYYLAVKARLDGTRAALAVARKLARRTHHILRQMGDQAWAPPQ
jgi:transposase